MAVRRYFAFVLLACAAVVLPAAGGKAALPGNSIILFGSRDCAPCVIELRNLQRTLSYRGSREVVLAWIDRIDQPLLPGPPPGARQVPWREARRMLATASGPELAVPLTIATNSRGQVCGLTREPLERGEMAALVRRCRD